jgi:protein-S-isoprenylcysteine O-methyltransferase Ste14
VVDNPQGVAMPLPRTALSRPLELKNRKLDLLWVILSLILAVFTWRYAIPDAYTPIELFVVLHIQAALIFAFRQPPRYSTRRPLEILVTILSLTYFLAFELNSSSSAPVALAGGIVTAIGSLLTIVSVQSLGRSFAVLPALREIRTSGMYRFARHPIYLSYIIAALGTLMRHPSLRNTAVVLAGIGLMLWRIRFEERLLTQDERYRNYVAKVRYRLIPGLY